MLKFPVRRLATVGVLTVSVVVLLTYSFRSTEKSVSGFKKETASLPTSSLSLLSAKAPNTVTHSTAAKDFLVWVENFQRTPVVERSVLVQAGLTLAQERRAQLKALIQTDPEQALSLAVPKTSREELPSSILDLLEEQVSGVGNYYVNCVVPLPGDEHAKENLQRSVTVNRREYRAHVYGATMGFISLKEVSVEGIALDGEMALSNGSTFRGSAFGDPTLGSSDVVNRVEPAWSHGPKKVLILRVDFSDMPGEPVYALNTNVVITTNYGASIFNTAGGISEFYRTSSYSNTDLVITPADVSPVYRMSNTAVYYAHGDGQAPYSGTIRDEARAQAAANYDLSSYDRIGVVCSDLSKVPTSKVGFAGVANIGGGDFLINGYYNFAVVAHELGHTYGAFHANWWKPQSNNIVGTEAEMLTDLDNGAMTVISKEYGDPYDGLGANSSNATDIRYHFNHWLKNMIGWIPDSSVQTVTTPGIYRVYAFDEGVGNPTNKLALKLCRDLIRDYWIGYRRQFAQTGAGATLLFGYNMNRASELLVCNSPGITATNPTLLVGQTLVDTNSGVTFTTLAQGGVAPNEYLDIQIAMTARISFATNNAVFETTRSNATMLVDRLGDVSGSTTVDYVCYDGTATNGIHYLATNGTLTWGPGDSSQRTISVPIISFPASESERSFTVALTNINNGAIPNPSRMTVSLRPPGNYDPSYFAAISSVYVKAMERQGDGRLVIGGSFSSVGNTLGKNSLAGNYSRLNPDGSRDYSFNCFPGAKQSPYGVNTLKLQADGKILIGGTFTNINNVTDYVRLARLNTDGSLDTTFHPPAFPSTVWDIAVQPDGKIVVVGDFRTVNGLDCQGICRLLPDGTVDFIFYSSTYFMGGGMYKVALDNYDSANGSEVRIVACGSLEIKFGQKKGLIRLHGNGSVDSTFNLPGSGLNSWVRTLAIQNDGKILIGGDFVSINGDSSNQHLLRLNSDGSVDPTFNSVIGGTDYPSVWAICPQPDGKILVGGYFATANGLMASNMIRLTSTGASDPSWDNGIGAANGSFGAILNYVPLPDGRVIASGDNRSIRGWVGTFYNRVVTSVALFTGITNRYGLGQFAAPANAILRGGSLTIPVMRVGGSDGTVKLDYSTQDGTGVAGSDYIKTQGTLTWADGDTSSKNITINCSAGAVAGSTFKLNLGIPRGGILLGAIRQTEFLIATNYSYEIWRAVNFTASQQTNESISGIAASPAGDEVPNLLKYALDIPPFISATNRVPSAFFNGDRLRMTFIRDPIKSDLTYEVDAADDFGVWSLIARSFGGGPTTNVNASAVSEVATNASFAVTVDDAASVNAAPRRFMRLKISK